LGGAAAPSRPAEGGEPAVVIRARPPFDLRLTALVLERAPGNRVDRWDEKAREYRRLLPGGVASVRAVPGGVEVRGASGPRDREALVRLLGLDVDLDGFYDEALSDPHLVPLLRALRGLKPQRFPTVWEALCNGVACQQVSLASGLAALGRLGARFGPGAGGLVALPTPEALVEADLGGLGLSRQKQSFLRGLASAVLDGALDGIEAMPSASARERMMALPGVGRWTAEYVLLRGLGRHEVFPADDVGAARSLAQLLGAGRLAPAEVRAMTERWGPWRGVVFFYLLGWRRALGRAIPAGQRRDASR
jgi:DNA-3-methyladenine glycosylase II